MEYKLISTDDQCKFVKDSNELLKKGFRPFSDLQTIFIPGWKIINDREEAPCIQYSQTFIKDGLPSFKDYSK